MSQENCKFQKWTRKYYSKTMPIVLQQYLYTLILKLLYATGPRNAFLDILAENFLIIKIPAGKDRIHIF